MNKICLRKANWWDVNLLFDWVNESEVRRNSFNTAKIEYEEHKRWYEKCMYSKDVDIYVLCFGNIPVGQIRLNYNAAIAIIDYSIDKSFRGQGYGNVLLKLIEAEIVSFHPEINVLCGNVKLDNFVSQRIFEENGYKKEYIEGENCYFTYQKIIIL